MTKVFITHQPEGTGVHSTSGDPGLWNLHGVNPATITAHDCEQMQEAGWLIAFGVGKEAGGFYTYRRDVAELAAKRLGCSIETVAAAATCGYFRPCAPEDVCSLPDGHAGAHRNEYGVWATEGEALLGDFPPYGVQS